ncbi:MAG: TPM domain-containing protein [Gemmatimonadales bacterium]
MRSSSGDQRFTGGWLGLGWRKATRTLGLLQLIPVLLAAQVAGPVTALFPAHPTDYLTDVAGLVDAPTAREINDLAARLRSATGAELAVVTLPTVNDRAPGDVALAIGRAWGVGGKGAIGDSARNAGLVLLVVPRTAEHKGELYLSTGRGVEGIVTDATSGRILDLMIPDLREQRYGPALLLGTQAVVSTVAKGFGVTDSVIAAADPFQTSSGGSDGEINPLVLFVIFIVISMIVSAIQKNSRGGRGGRRGGGPYMGGWGGGGWGGGFGGGGGGGGGGGFGGFGGGGGFSGGGAGRSF